LCPQEFMLVTRPRRGEAFLIAHLSTSMGTVYLLWQKGPQGLEDAEMLIGVHTVEVAKSAIAAVVNKPGFVDYPDRFEICAYELGKLQWAEGFVIPKD